MVRKTVSLKVYSKNYQDNLIYLTQFTLKCNKNINLVNVFQLLEKTITHRTPFGPNSSAMHCENMSTADCRTIENVKNLFEVTDISNYLGHTVWHKVLILNKMWLLRKFATKREEHQITGRWPRIEEMFTITPFTFSR